MSGNVCFAAETGEISAVFVNAVGVGAVLLFLGVSVRVSVLVGEANELK
jgi:hypothetical protein